MIGECVVNHKCHGGENWFEWEGVMVKQRLYPDLVWTETRDCLDVRYLLNYGVC